MAARAPLYVDQGQTDNPEQLNAQTIEDPHMLTKLGDGSVLGFCA